MAKKKRLKKAILASTLAGGILAGSVIPQVSNTVSDNDRTRPTESSQSQPRGRWRPNRRLKQMPPFLKQANRLPRRCRFRRWL